MKLRIYLCLLAISLSNYSFSAGTVANNQSESQTISQLVPIEAIQEQNKISNQYDQKQAEIEAEEEEYFDELDGFDGGFYPYGMYGVPYMDAPVAVVPINITTNQSAPSKPKMIDYYESQLPNGDILFKQ